MSRMEARLSAMQTRDCFAEEAVMEPIAWSEERWHRAASGCRDVWGRLSAIVVRESPRCKVKHCVTPGIE